MQTGIDQNHTFPHWLAGKSTVTVNGVDLPVRKLDGSFLSDTSDYQSHYFLLNNSIIYIKSKGAPQESDFSLALSELTQKLESLGGSQYVLIWDTSEITAVSVKIRKLLSFNHGLFERLFSAKYIVANAFIKTIFSIYNLTDSPKPTNLFLVSSPLDALESICSRQWPQPKGSTSSGFNFSTTELEALSKADLVELVGNMRDVHKQRVNELLGAIGHISWNGTFRPVQIKTEENDPFFELFNAISLIQHDALEMIMDLQDLNQNLELKVAERIVDIIDTESNLRSILDNSDSVTWLINSRFELIDFNIGFADWAQKQYGLQPKLRQNVLDMITDGVVRTEWKTRYSRALNGRPGIYLDQILEGEEERTYEVKTFPINEVGNIKGVSIFVKDITDIKRSEMDLVNKNRDLEKVNQELDSFVYRVSHDLRAPLTSILGLISLMKLETDQSRFESYIDMQEKSVKKLDRFIRDIINLSRNSRLGVAIEQIKFRSLVQSLFENHKYTENAAQIVKTVHIKGKAPFYSDLQRVSVILSNLISNSVKYANYSKDQSELDVHITLNEECAIIEVTDNGVGIAPEHIGKIFKMFFRASHDDSGSGLGLYIVKDTVEKLSGKISVRSELRKGTTFTVVLPNFKERFDSLGNLECDV